LDASLIIAILLADKTITLKDSTRRLRVICWYNFYIIQWTSSNLWWAAHACV